MADRTVSVFVTATVAQYVAAMAQAKAATVEFATSGSAAADKNKASWDKVGTGMLLAGGIIAAGVGLAVVAAADFDHQMSSVQANINDKSVPTMAALGDAALEAGKATMFSAQDAADAENMLAKSGMTAANILGGGLNASLGLAAATQTTLADATMYVAATMEQFSLKGADAGHIADVLAAGADKSLGGVNDLAEGLKYAGVPAHQFGISLDETVGTLAMFAKNGILGTMAGTSLRMMLIKMAAPTSAAKSDMAGLGLAFFNSKGAFVGLADVAGQLHDKLSGLTQQQRENTLVTLFGARSLSESNILYVQGAAGVTKWTQAVNDQGFAALQASTKMNNLRGDLSILRTTLNVALVEGGQGGQAPLRTLTQDVTSLVNGFAGLPAPVLQAGLALGAVAAAALLLGGTVVMATSRITAMKLALTSMGVEAEAAGALLGTLAVAGASVAATAITVDWYTNAVNANMDRTAPGAKAATAALLQFATTGKAGGASADLINNQFSHLGDTINNVFSDSAGHKVVAFFDSAKGGQAFGSGSDTTNAVEFFKTMDEGLAGLTTSGHGPQAEAMFHRITDAATKQGYTVAQVAAALPQYATALTATGQAGAGSATAINAASAASLALTGATDAAGSALLAMGAGASAVDANVKALAKTIQTDMDAAAKTFASDTDVIGNYNPKPLADAVAAAQDTLNKAKDSAAKSTGSAAPKPMSVSEQQQVAKAQQALDAASTKSADAQAKAQQNLSDLQARIADKHKMTVAQMQSVDTANSAVADAQAALDKARQDQADASLTNSYKTQITEANQFTTDITAVAARGLDPAVIAKLLAEGPTKAMPALQALVGANSASLIKMTNDSEAALSRINGQVVEQARLTSMAVNSHNDQLTKDYGTAMGIDAGIAASGGKATATSLAAQLHMGVPQVLAIAKEFGISLAVGVTSGTTPSKAAVQSLQDKIKTLEGKIVNVGEYGSAAAIAQIAALQAKIDALTGKQVNIVTNLVTQTKSNPAYPAGVISPAHGGAPSSAAGILAALGLGGITGVRAAGGPVQAGLSYLVGEHRPEVFTPDASGMISPRADGLRPHYVSAPGSGASGASTHTVTYIQPLNNYGPITTPNTSDLLALADKKRRAAMLGSH